VSWVAALAMLLCVGLAQASVPQRERIEQAVAQTNAAAGRGQALQLELVMQIGERPAVAHGQLVSHPAGMARLELRGAGDLVERHLLQGDQLLASRDGRLLEHHRLFLPPLFVLQVTDGEALRSALLSFEVEPEPVGLAQCGEEDCLVLGDPERGIQPMPGPEPAGLEDYERLKSEFNEARRLQYEAARLWFWGGFDRLLAPWLSEELEPGPEELGQVAAEDDASAVAEDQRARSDSDPGDPAEFGPGSASAPTGSKSRGTSARPPPALGMPEDGPAVAEPYARVDEALAPPPPPPASLWVSREGYEIRGLDTTSGGRVRLGPLASFGGVLVPAWILIEEPGQEPVRFEVVGATAVDTFPATFSEQWLLAPPPNPPWGRPDLPDPL